MGEGRGAQWAEAVRTGRTEEYWRSLSEYLGVPPERGEFPPGADEAPEPPADGNGLSRRSFLTLLGASMALAGVSGCTSKRAEKILPYTQQPPEVTPGIPLTYATSMVVDGVATGLLVEAREGRPIKVEGNPEHPASLGATGVLEQASVLSLYDPNRATSLRQRNVPRSWRGFVKAFHPGDAPQGRRLAFLMPPTSSPTLVGLMERVRARNPDSRFFFHAPLAEDGALEAARALYGRAVVPNLALDRADVVLSLDSDFLASGPFHLRHARDFARNRRPDGPDGRMNRLYVAEPTWTPTGSLADHRLRLRGGEVVRLARAVAAEVLAGSPAAAALGARLGRWRDQGPERRWVEAVANDLRANRGRSLVVAGPRQPAEVHALAWAMNDALGNVGRTVGFVDSPIHEAGTESHDLAALVDHLNREPVDALIVLGGNPVYTAPADLPLAEAFRKARTQAYLGLHENETAEACEWFVPGVHYLESWGDARAWDGTVSLIQPLIQPLYGGRTDLEVLSVFVGATEFEPRELVRQQWARLGDGFDVALRKGLVDGTTHHPVDTTPDWQAIGGLLREPSDAPGGFELALHADAKVHDGSFANNPWLMELPDPITTLTWDNAALVSPATAARLEVDNGDVVELAAGERRLELPVVVVPGHADESVSVSLGYGRRGAEAVARDVGANAYLLRTTANRWFVPGVQLRKTGRSEDLALTQVHWSMEGRPLILARTLEEYRKNPEFTHDHKAVQPTLRAEWPAEGVQWGMAVDLSLCTGCKSCVVACQAENNIPVVGKVNVRKSREMHWLRIDRYFSGTAEDPQVQMQPMMCQHCERAPCEYVCPVKATVHSSDGLNEMVYNRCVGTRFCSNNCPYKVRRFNFFEYTERGPVESMAFNPDVTVRARGVMEKCTYCVQRIRRKQNVRRAEGQSFDPRSVQSACQQACPTQAIVFGPVSDPEAPVTRMQRQPRVYKVLNQAGTEPRTQYLARITNPNPELHES